jgi:acyl-CoA thioesterase
MFQLADFEFGLVSKQIDASRYQLENMDYYGLQAQEGGEATAAVADVISGGQLLAQAVALACSSQEGKTAKAVTAVFARAGRVSQPLEVAVQEIQNGRSMGTVVLTFTQNDRPFATATVLLHVPDEDLIRHAAKPQHAVGSPGEPGVRLAGRGLFEFGYPPGTEKSGPDDVGPAEQPMWVRCPAAPDEQVLNQALLAFITNFQPIGVAMKPHVGLSVDQSHRSVSTGVLSHSVSFHEPFTIRDWLLLDLDAPYAGRGRVYGRGNVFTQAGELVASLSQEAMVRGISRPGGTGTSL